MQHIHEGQQSTIHLVHMYCVTQSQCDRWFEKQWFWGCLATYQDPTLLQRYWRISGTIKSALTRRAETMDRYSKHHRLRLRPSKFAHFRPGPFPLHFLFSARKNQQHVRRDRPPPFPLGMALDSRPSGEKGGGGLCARHGVRKLKSVGPAVGPGPIATRLVGDCGGGGGGGRLTEKPAKKRFRTPRPVKEKIMLS